ncbi:MAG: alpha-L-rhamnosidase N-terminal domain-containing protein, partial [Bacilli bacterium]|nr:alpha-L-rhamnosidase N-terminal domain-containing protein [Bacilli bacterium]
MKAIRLRTASLLEPRGSDIRNPVFSWNCEGGLRQTAYRVVVKCGEEILFDTGKVESSSMEAAYAGKPLNSRDVVIWEVTLYDENGKEGTPASTFFEMGLLHKEDWKAKWIRGDYRPKDKKPFIAPYMGKAQRKEKVDYFQKTFEVKSIQKARLYITALGLYEIHINGNRVGDFVMAPGYTDYTKRVQYQTYDVASLLQTGTNVIEAKLADGWYRGSTGAWGIWCQYGRVTKLLAQLEITDEEGKAAMVITDASWRWSNDGPIVIADNKDGEVIDARLSPT